MYVLAFNTFCFLWCCHRRMLLLFVSVPALLEKGAVILSWGGAVFVTQLVWYWLRLGGMGFLWLVGF